MTLGKMRVHGSVGRSKGHANFVIAEWGAAAVLLSYPPPGAGTKKIVSLCVYNALFRPKQWNSRIDPFYHDHVADFACRRPAIVRGSFRYLINCPAMGAGEINTATFNLGHASIPP